MEEEKKLMGSSFKEEELRKIFDVPQEFADKIGKVLVNFFTALDKKDSATLAMIGENMVIYHSNGQVTDIDGVINAIETASVWGGERKRHINIDRIYYKEGDSLCVVDWSNYLEIKVEDKIHKEHYKENWVFLVKKGKITPIRASYILVVDEEYKEGV